MEMSGTFHAPATLTLEKTTERIEYEEIWDQVPVWTV